MKKGFSILSVLSLLLIANTVVAAKKLDYKPKSDFKDEQNKKKVKKKTKYDFSLFKFVTPDDEKQSDSTIVKPKKEEELPFKEDTTYEIPRSFFKFS